MELNHFDFWGIFDDLPHKMVKAIANNDSRRLEHLVSRLKDDKLNTQRFGPGWSYLHYASILGHDEAVDCLLRHGANVNVLTDHNESALFMAIRHKHPSTVRFLLENGAHADIVAHGVEIKGGYFQTLAPLSLAKLLDLEEVVIMLEQALEATLHFDTTVDWLPSRSNVDGENKQNSKGSLSDSEPHLTLTATKMTA